METLDLIAGMPRTAAGGDVRDSRGEQPPSHPFRLAREGDQPGSRQRQSQDPDEAEQLQILDGALCGRISRAAFETRQGHGQTGVILAERLGIPSSTIIMDVQIEGSALRVKRELEGGWFQWIAMPLPALLTIQSGINQLRYATLKGIMAAKKKEIRKAALPDGLQAAQQIVGLAVPTRSKQTHMIDGSAAEAAKELVRRLREEARAL